ncbi:MAG: manganese efflux pump [Ignavibacteriales bacterium]|nr:manganese efflux pump [Ignavibacteriales bacterium]
MDTLTIILIAIGLSLDAVAVSISMGLSISTLKIKHGLIIGIFFGVFQAVMPAIGWFFGRSFQTVIETFDHWIAFGLLTIIGVKMIYESLSPKPENIKKLSFQSLLVLSLATSIDAFAIGISFAMLEISIVTPILIIGSITFFFSFLGVGLGKHVGQLIPKKIEVVGGIILIGIGLKIILQHLNLF